MLDVTGGTAKIGLKLGVDDGVVLCNNTSVERNTEHKAREKHKMNRNPERNSLLAANTTDAIDRDRINRIANIADVLCQLGLDAMPGINGILIHVGNPGPKFGTRAVYVKIEDAAALATGLPALKSMGVL